MIQIKHTDTTTYDVPGTLILDSIVTKANYSVERAPFSTAVVVAGDGLPAAEPLNLSGNVYFSSDALADAWISQMMYHLDNIASLVVDGTVIPVWGADIVAVPGFLPRIMAVKIKVYPK